MSMQNSSVMEEFFKIAEQKNLLKTAAEKNPNKEDDKTVEEKRLPKPEKHIMEIAHPEPVFVAESRGEGGLVENELEHQKKWIEMINKMPTGSLVGRYASMIDELIKMAELCDELGQTEAADKLTAAAKKALAAEEDAVQFWDLSDPKIDMLAEMTPDEREESRKRRKLREEAGPEECAFCGGGCEDPFECMTKFLEEGGEFEEPEGEEFEKPEGEEFEKPGGRDLLPEEELPLA